MKIAIVPNNTDNNCYGVRNAMPAEFLRKLGHEVKVENKFEVLQDKLGRKALNPRLIDWCDVIVFNRHYNMDNPTMVNVFNYAKDNGKRVIYETDDLLEALETHNPGYREIQKNVSMVPIMAKMADACTTTGPYLKEELEKYNKDVIVLPNCVDPKKWKERKKGNKTVKVGWAGGSSHVVDLMIIMDVIKELKQSLDFDFIVFGLAPMPWDEYMKFNAKRHSKEKLKHVIQVAPWYGKTIEIDQMFRHLQWTHQPFVKLPKFNQTLSDLNLDIGLCPLEDTRFNRCKSAIKFYEYAMVGTATLASQVSPYKEEVGYCAKNRHNKWKSKLRRLIEDVSFRNDLARTQRNWVLENRDINNQINKWEDAYRNISNNRNISDGA